MITGGSAGRTGLPEVQFPYVKEIGKSNAIARSLRIKKRIASGLKWFNHDQNDDRD